jgi:hypothetical protein
MSDNSRAYLAHLLSRWGDYPTDSQHHALIPSTELLSFKSELGVAAVANWCLSRSLTATKEDLTIRFGCVLNGCKIRVFMTSITERLLAALTTGAPEVTFPSFNFYGVWRFLRNYWL